MKREDWEGKGFSFFANRACEYYPCHEGAEVESFNCLFCYCPLYLLGERCGGNFKYTVSGVKDCSGCMIPHRPDSYGDIVEKFQRFCGK